MKNFKLSTLFPYLIGGGILIALIYYVYTKIYNTGKAAGTKEPEKLPIDKPWGNTLNTEQSNQVRAMSTKLHDLMKGASLLYADYQPFQDYLTYSDTMFTAVYNDFNDRFYNEPDFWGSPRKESLKSWIENEYTLWTAVKDPLLAKFQKLNLQ